MVQRALRWDGRQKEVTEESLDGIQAKVEMARPSDNTEVHWVSQARAAVELLGNQQKCLPSSGGDQART